MAGAGSGDPGFTGEERQLLAGTRYAICAGTFHRELADRLIAGARAGFAEAGAEGDVIELFEVPGAFELPVAAKLCAESGRFEGVACLGAVIRGETDHYDFVAGEAARGLQQVQVETGVPCAFGVLTCDTMEQALERSGGDERDSGRAAAIAVLRVALLARTLAA